MLADCVDGISLNMHLFLARIRLYECIYSCMHTQVLLHLYMVLIDSSIQFEVINLNEMFVLFSVWDRSRWMVTSTHYPWLLVDTDCYLLLTSCSFLVGIRIMRESRGKKKFTTVVQGIASYGKVAVGAKRVRTCTWFRGGGLSDWLSCFD